MKVNQIRRPNLIRKVSVEIFTRDMSLNNDQVEWH